MKRKIVLLLLVSILLFSTLLGECAPNAEANGTIYIRADGSIDPPTTPLATFDNARYTFTDNINDSIVVERDNVVVDGAGYILSASYPPNDIGLYDRNNVTLKNMKIQGLWSEGGVELMRSSNCTISGNNITADSPLQPWGLRLDNSSNNRITNNTFINNGLSAIFSYQNTVENNTVNGKPLIYLENVSDHSVSDAGQVILVRCDNVRVKDLDLLSTTAGVELFETNNTTISENNMTENNLGIMLKSSSNNTITANNITRNISGIWLESSSNNTISRSDIAGGGHLGVAGISNTGMNLRYSNHNSISGNNITNNENGIIFEWNSDNNCAYENNITNNGYGIDLSESSNNSMVGNNITNNQWGISLVLSSSISIFDNSITDNWEGMTLGDSSNSIVSGNNITTNSNLGITLDGTSSMNVSGNNIAANHYEGISLSGNSFDNSISDNNIIDNSNGIAITESFDNSIFDNNITSNKCGVFADHSLDNIFYHNNLVNNGVPLVMGQVFSSESVNIWDNGNPFGGNYWSDYSGVDANHDGIGDTSYVIDANNTDHYPLMVPTVIPEFPSSLILALFVMATLLAVMFYTRKNKISDVM